MEGKTGRSVICGPWLNRCFGWEALEGVQKYLEGRTVFLHDYKDCWNEHTQVQPGGASKAMLAREPWELKREKCEPCRPMDMVTASGLKAEMAIMVGRLGQKKIPKKTGKHFSWCWLQQTVILHRDLTTFSAVNCWRLQLRCKPLLGRF